MGTVNTIEYLFNHEISDKRIKDTGNWTQADWDNALDAVQKDMAGYFNTTLQPVIEGDKLIEFIERFPRDPGNPHRLTRFTPEQRKQRRETIEMFREFATEFSFGITERAAKYSHMRRPWLILLDSFGTDAIPQMADNNMSVISRNDEIVNLFSSDGKPDANYRKSKIDEKINGGSSPENAEKLVDEELDARRVEIVMQKLHASEGIFNRLDEMTDMTLPPDQLALNFYTILTACQFYMEAENFAKESSLSLNQEQRKWIAGVKDKLDIFQAARGKLAYMANPLYEYIDLPEMEYFDVTALSDAYENEIFDYEQKTNQKKEFSAKDNFNNLLGDLNDITMSRQLTVIPAAKKIAADLSFDINTKWIYEDSRTGLSETNGNANSAQLTNGNYVAVEQGKRVIILCPPKPGKTKVEVLKFPEEFYNAYVVGKIKNLKERLSIVDPGYVHSSPAFREMRRSFERVAELGKLPDYPDDGEISRYSRYLRDLSAKCKKYLEYKKGGETEFEHERVKFAGQLSDFASMKLRQLDIVFNAKRTLDRYYGNEILGWDDVQAIAATDRDNYVINWRKEKPLEWIKNNISDYIKHTPTVLLQAMRTSYNNLSNFIIGEPETAPDVIRLIGATIMSQILKTENNDIISEQLNKLIKTAPAAPNGDVRLREDIIDALGENAYAKIVGSDNKDFDSINKALSEYNPEELADYFKPSFYTKYGLTEYGTLYNSYIKPIADLPENAPEECKTALRDFAQKNILDLSREIYLSTVDNIVMEPEKARILVANCVIYGMIKLERAGKGNAIPGEMEQMLADPKKTVQLRNSIMGEEDFDKLCKNCFITMDDAISYRNIKKMLIGTKTLKAADTFMRKFAANVENQPQIQGDKLIVIDVKDEVKNPQNAGKAPADQNKASIQPNKII